MKYQKVIETNKELMPKGEKSGDISYDHQRLEQLDDLRSIKEIAYLFQNPSAQMAMHPKVLILDEPTSSLDEGEVEKLFKVMNMLKKRGTAIVFVTHFLEQVYAVCDRITVLRNGHFVGEYKTEELPRFKLVATMMGKEFDDLADIKGSGTSSKKQSDEVVIEAKGLYHKGTIKPFDIKIHKGEVVGLSGLLGSGRSELVRAIYGADKPDGGELYVKV